MSVSEILLALVRYGVSVGVGIVIGIVFSSGKVHIHGKAVTVPFIDRNSKNFTLIVILMLVTSIFAVGITALQARRQEACNAEFNSTLKVRSSVSQDNEMLATSDRKSLADLFVKLLSIPQNISREEGAAQSRKLIEDYNAQVGATDTKRAMNEQIRKDNPLPEPKCGAK